MYNLTTTCRFGGVETFVWAISRELAARGEEVHIIGGRGKIRKESPGVKIILFPFWPRNRIPDLGTRFRKLVERLSLGVLALSTVVKEKYDLVHIHKPYDLPFGLLVKRRSGANLILGSHGTDFFPGDKFFFSRGVDGVVTCSQFNGGQIAERYGVRPKVIYNGIDPGIFRPLPPDPAIRHRFNLFPGQDKNIVYAGRLIGLKGVGILLQAMARVCERFPCKLLVIGDGEARPGLENLSKRLGISERVIFTGFVPHQELPRYYSVADVGVFPSVADETFGVAICEAMACGKAVVSTPVGGIPELVLKGETGLLAEPRNPEDLADKISELLGDEDLRRGMGEKGSQRVREYFTWEKVADRLLQAYDNVRRGKKIDEIIHPGEMSRVPVERR